MCGFMLYKMDRLMDGWMIGYIDLWKDGCIYVWMDK